MRNGQVRLESKTILKANLNKPNAMLMPGYLNNKTPKYSNPAILKRA